MKQLSFRLFARVIIIKNEEEKEGEEKKEGEEEKKDEKDECDGNSEKKKVTIADQIKPPSFSIKSLRIKNPDTLLPLQGEDNDYRADMNAPKTPANVRGNRSILHKVGN